jgi:hypothetical protein
MATGLYRAMFCFQIAGTEYLINYIKATAKDPYFTETIYRGVNNQPIAHKKINHQVPTAETALQSLQDLLNPKQPQ